MKRANVALFGILVAKIMPRIHRQIHLIYRNTGSTQSAHSVNARVNSINWPVARLFAFTASLRQNAATDKPEINVLAR